MEQGTHRRAETPAAKKTAIAFSPDSKMLAAATEDEDNSPIVLHGHAGAVRNFAFSPDGASLLSGGDDYTVLCWDVAAFPRRRTPTEELSAAQLTALWTDLESTDVRRAQQAVATLIQGPVTAPPFLEKALPPASTEQMAAVAVLLADLDSEQFNRRERASRQLMKLGEDLDQADAIALEEIQRLLGRNQEVERVHVICYNAEVSQAYRARLHAKDAE